MAASIIVISLRKLQQSKVPPRKLPKNKRLSSTQMMILQHLLASQLNNTSKRTIIHSISNKNSSRQSMTIPTTLNSSNSSSSSMWNRGSQVLWCANRKKFSSSQSFRKKFICHQRLSLFHRKPLKKLSCSMTPTTSWRSLIDRHQNLRKRK